MEKEVRNGEYQVIRIRISKACANRLRVLSIVKNASVPSLCAGYVEEAVNRDIRDMESSRDNIDSLMGSVLG